MWNTHTNEDYVVVRKNGILQFAATWMELQGLVGSEINQREKKNIRWPHMSEVEREIKWEKQG